MQDSEPKIIPRKKAKQAGMVMYYTGKPCKYGHVDYRYCSSGRCRTCDYELHKTPEWRAKRREYEQRPYMRERRARYNKMPHRKKSLAELQKKSYRENKPVYLMRLMVSRIPRAVRAGLISKTTEEKLGYSLAEFKAHIERQFQDGMTWDNHGEWHIDHIIPVSKYPKERIERVNDLDNLRPMWAFENLSKGDRVEAASD